MAASRAGLTPGARARDDNQTGMLARQGRFRAWVHQGRSPEPNRATASGRLTPDLLHHLPGLLDRVRVSGHEHASLLPFGLDPIRREFVVDEGSPQLEFGIRDRRTSAPPVSPRGSGARRGLARW